MILKDSFELRSSKLSKTVIIANVSPSVSDKTQTKNTLGFVGPIKIGASEKVTDILEEDVPTNPTTWSNAYLRKWLDEYSSGKIDTEQFCPYESGKQLICIP